jgi:hypothetical protein
MCPAQQPRPGVTLDNPVYRKFRRILKISHTVVLLDRWIDKPTRVKPPSQISYSPACPAARQGAACRAAPVGATGRAGWAAHAQGLRPQSQPLPRSAAGGGGLHAAFVSRIDRGRPAALRRGMAAHAAGVRQRAPDRRQRWPLQPLFPGAQDHRRASAAEDLPWCDTGDRGPGLVMVSTRVDGGVSGLQDPSIRHTFRGYT